MAVSVNKEMLISTPRGQRRGEWNASTFRTRSLGALLLLLLLLWQFTRSIAYAYTGRQHNAATMYIERIARGIFQLKMLCCGTTLEPSVNMLETRVNRLT